MMFSWQTFLAFVLATGLLGADNRALLVGVSEYPALDKAQWLVGPENDVALAREVLTGDRFKFPAKNIASLVGWPKKEELRPTRANIAKAFEKLAKDATKDDLIFILMSGHGSQQPANEQEDDIETDGLDEVFLPADTTEWNPVKATIEGAIIDDEIKVWTDKIRAKGAFVWIILWKGKETEPNRHEESKTPYHRESSPCPDRAQSRRPWPLSHG